MKLKKGFIPHITNDEYYLVPTSDVKFSGIIKGNKTAYFIWECLMEETQQEKIVEKVLDKYQVDRSRAEKSVIDVLTQLKEIGAIDE